MELTYKGELVTLHGDPELGEFVGETKHATFESVTWEGVTYDCKTFYWWDDPDYPHENDVDKALKLAEKENSTEWPNYLDYKDSQYHFNGYGFMVYPWPVEGETVEDVDILPNHPLGRIPIEDLQLQ